MNSQGKITEERPEGMISLLAETVAVGLHSLAQPLTKVQWSLETLAMVQSADTQQEEVSDALVALERVTAALDFLRCVISPYRRGARFEAVSVRDALLKAADEHGEILRNEQINLALDTTSGEGIVEAPKHVIDQMCFSLVGLLCFFAPLSVSVTVNDGEESVSVEMSLMRRDGSSVPVTNTQQLIFNIRAYVEVLAGEFAMESDFSSLRISLPKSPIYLQPVVSTVKK